MLKIANPRPAAVYAPGDGTEQEGVRPVLGDRRLYLLDRRTERVENLALSVVERPILRLHLFYAAMGSEHGAAVFVADHLTSLGSDKLERVAVVGAFLDLGCDVIVDRTELGSHWYYDRATRFDFRTVGMLVEDLTSMETLSLAVWNQWSTGPETGHLTAFPTNLRLGYRDARLRVKELVEFAGMSIADAAARVMVEGYRNAKERRIWYPQAVRCALEHGL